MPEAKTIMLYQYGELSPKAKETALAWWLESQDSSDYESTVDDFMTCAAILGVGVGTRLERTYGGGQRAFPDVRWSLSYCQGDGAAFNGSYAYKPGAAKAMRKFAPQDSELHRIADSLQSLQAAWQYGLRATMKEGSGSNSYTHSGTMAVDVEFIDSNGNERTIPQAKEPEANEADRTLTRLMRDLADWFYARLREEHEYLTSEEQVADVMEANEYTFREDGRRED